MILIELTVAKDTTPTLETLYFSTDAFITEPSDTPSSVAFSPALMDPGSLGVSAFSNGRTGGGTRLEVGEVVLSNVDGGLDDLLDWGLDGQDIVIRSGEPGGAYPSTFPIVLSGVMETVDSSFDAAAIRLRDRQFIFDQPALPNRYGGTNSLPNGLDGTANDIKDTRKPRTYGEVFEVQYPCVNTSKLTYQVNDGAVQSIPQVYDRGVLLTLGTAHANSTALQAATVSAGTYDVCLSEGYFRLGSNPSGVVTANVIEGANAAARTAAQVLKKIAQLAGVVSISASDVSDMDTANSSVVGIAILGETTFTEAMDAVSRSVGAFYAFDSSVVLRMGILTAPSGTPLFIVEDIDMLSGIERTTPKDLSIPVWSATVRHSKVYTVQQDVAGSVTVERRAFLGQEYRQENQNNATLKNLHKLASEMSVDSLLVNAADANTEAARLLALYGVRRDIFEVPVDLSMIVAYSPKLLDVVSLVLGRFGMSSGKLFRIIGLRVELASNRAVLTLWG